MERAILGLRTVIGFIAFGFGIGLEWVSARFMDAAVWLTQDNAKYKLHKETRIIIDE